MQLVSVASSCRLRLPSSSLLHPLVTPRRAPSSRRRDKQVYISYPRHWFARRGAEKRAGGEREGKSERTRASGSGEEVRRSKLFAVPSCGKCLPPREIRLTLWTPEMPAFGQSAFEKRSECSVILELYF